MNNKKQKEKHSYVFPDLMAKFMRKVDMRTQMESSMLSMTMIMIGMMIMVTYLFFFTEGSIFYKGIIIFNLVCGFLFISSFLVTTYQQYISYMDMMGIDSSKHKAEIKRRGNIFKRIYLAIKNRKKKSKKIKKNEEVILAPTLIKEALHNKKTIDTQKEIDMDKLKKEADKLRKQFNTVEKEVE